MDEWYSGSSNVVCFQYNTLRTFAGWMNCCCFNAMYLQFLVTGHYMTLPSLHDLTFNEYETRLLSTTSNILHKHYRILHRALFLVDKTIDFISRNLNSICHLDIRGKDWINADSFHWSRACVRLEPYVRRVTGWNFSGCYRRSPTSCRPQQYFRWWYQHSAMQPLW